MKISVLCTDHNHPVNEVLVPWIGKQSETHIVDLVRRKSELQGGDLLFLVSCTEIISAPYRAMYDVCIVMHASDLPVGRGWSPHIWQIINGATVITLSAIDAADKVDTGKIWAKRTIDFEDTLTWSEINEKLFIAEIEMMDHVINNFTVITPVPQSESIEPTYYPRRVPLDSAIDPNKSIGEQFDLIRVCDPTRFPAFFEFRGRRYILKVETCVEDINDH
jgi:methionyl-tRNA formyltransferase